jgi:hypothetical protein
VKRLGILIVAATLMLCGCNAATHTTTPVHNGATQLSLANTWQFNPIPSTIPASQGGGYIGPPDFSGATTPSTCPETAAGIPTTGVVCASGMVTFTDGSTGLLTLAGQSQVLQLGDEFYFNVSQSYWGLQGSATFILTGNVYAGVSGVAQCNGGSDENSNICVDWWAFHGEGNDFTASATSETQ